MSGRPGADGRPGGGASAGGAPAGAGGAVLAGARRPAGREPRAAPAQPARWPGGRPVGPGGGRGPG